MEVVSVLDESLVRDPTWKKAYAITQRELRLPSHFWRMVRTGWNRQVDPADFVKLLGMCKMHPACLFNAAGMEVKPEPSAASIEQAIQFLGVRYSAVIIAINFTCRSILRNKPPPAWKAIYQEMMTKVEIGYKFGARVPEIELEGGALVGFAKTAGLGVLLAHDPKLFKEWHSMTQGYHGKKLQIDMFGCEAYQISSFILQQLGFGTEVAVGAALATGQLDPTHIEFGRNIMKWKAAFLWVEALRLGRGFPKELEMRSFFKELTPPKEGKKNMALDVLYTEVAKVKSEGSKWTWHLPKPSYEDTAAFMHSKK